MQTDFKLFWRIKKRNPLIFFITIAGLIISITLNAFIITWVKSEINYDTFHKASDRIYRVCSSISLTGNNFSSNMAPPPLAAQIVKEFPEVEDATRLWNWENISISHLNADSTQQVYNEEYVFEADSNFFSFFDFELLYGSPKEVLKKPWTVVLSKSIAEKYFGKEAVENEGVIGQFITLTLWGRPKLCQVLGVAEDAPHNSHFKYNILLSSYSDPWSKSNAWTDNTYYTYVRLHEKSNPHLLEARFPAFIQKHASTQIAANYDIDFGSFSEKGNDWSYFLQPLESIHLNSSFSREMGENGDIQNVWILSLTGFFIFLIAIINFVNLNIAASFSRVKEIGVKKSMGSQKGQLFWQFLQESALTVLIAIALAIAFILLISKQVEVHLAIEMEYQIIALIALFSLLCITVIGGIYPAIYLSSIPTFKALKGKINVSGKSIRFRNLLVIAQFSISIGLIAGVIIINKQLHFVGERSLGFEKENVIIIKDPSLRMKGKDQVFFHSLIQNPNIKDASLCMNYPGSGMYNHPIILKNEKGNTDNVVRKLEVGYDFAEVFNMKTHSGRSFDRTFNDHKTKNKVIINQKAARQLGFEQPLGESVKIRALNTLKVSEKEYQIVGILEDFNYQSLHHEIAPLALFLRPQGENMAIKIQGSSQETISFIETKWNEILPGVPFDFQFVDQQVQKMYQKELQLGKVLMALTFIIVFIACLGLFGLTAFIIQRRTKEIGVRKVLGGNTWSILQMLLLDFLKWIAIAFAIACPIVYMVMQNWLENFSYHTEISWWIFPATGVIAMLVAFVTVWHSSFKAARLNPVHSLKEE